jgi:cAMP-dependent protein kinase regulator
MSESEEEYATRVVDPILADLRKAVMNARPGNPVQFMVEHLMGSRLGMSNILTAVKTQATLVSDDDEEDQITSPVSAGVLSPSHSPSNLQKYFEKGARSSFSAVPTDDILRLFEDKPPGGEKTPDEFTRVRSLLEKSTLAKDRDGEELDSIARGMVEVVIDQPGVEIDCDRAVIIVEVGVIEKICGGNTDASSCQSIRPGEVVGDPSALFAFCPNVCVLRTLSDHVVFWRISQEYLDYITRRSAIERRERYLNFLSSVPIFSSMDEEELAKVCDALKHERVPAGTTFMKQGELGNKFCIIESGKCVATRAYVSGQTIPTEVFRYKAGDYVGELSLLHNEPRAANVTAITDVSLLCIDRKSFKRLLGPIQDILLRNTVRYQVDKSE